MAYWHTKQLRDHKYLDLIIGPGQRSVIKTLAEYMGRDGTLTMSQVTLAKESAESVSSVRRALEQAEDLKLISKHRHGRTSAERIVWHACPPDCSEKTHTGRTDTAKPVLSKESTADGFVKPPKKRRTTKAKPTFKPKESPDTSVQSEHSTTSVQSDENPGVSFKLDTLKDKPRLNTSKGVISANSQPDTSVQSEHSEAYASLAQTVETLSKLADTTGHDPLTIETEVLLDLLNDHPQALRVAALAVDLWGAIPWPAVADVNASSGFTHLHSQQLNEHAAQVAGINTMRLYEAIRHYTRTQPGSKPWRTLSKTFKAGYVDLCNRQTLTQPDHMSEVADNVEMMHTGKQFGQLFTPAPVDELMARLSALSPE